MVNFINILRAAFMRAGPKSTQKMTTLLVFCVLLGLALVKAARRMWMKLTPKAAKEVTEFQFRFLRSK